MTSEELRAAQAPVKTRYREDAEAAKVTMRVTGCIDPARQVCAIDTKFPSIVEAGLHPAAGGDGRFACSGDMLLQALAACAGVTLGAVATAMNLPVRGGTVTAEGDLDFRGTLGVSKDVPVGFSAVRVHFALDSDCEPDAVATLLRLTERYCVIFQTLKQPPALSADVESRPAPTA